jgi:tetratricopeptide (TPR) repeat protein
MKITFCARKRLASAFFLLAAAGCLNPLMAQGLSGEYLISQRWRDMFSRYSPLTNPALLTEENYVDLRACGAFPLEGDFQLGELGLTIPVGLYESWGISGYIQGSGGVHPSSYNSSGNIDTASYGALQYDEKFFIVGSYANNIWRGLSIGANIGVSVSTNYDSPYANLSGDFGLTYRLGRNPVLGDHVMGLTLQNVLEPLADALRISSLGDQSYTTNLKLTWLAYFLERRIDAGLDVSVKNVWAALAHARQDIQTDSGIVSATNSLEYDYNFRVGGWIFNVLDVYFLMGNIRLPNEYYGFAAGVNVPHLNQGRDLQLLFQYIGMPSTENVSTYSLYLRGEIGMHREELYARKMARVLDMAPNELYNRACKLYFEGRYWDALFLFSRILTQFPTFFKNDWVQYYRGACLEKLDMRDISAQNYRETKEDYPKSTVVPRADLGLMRLAYRDENSALVGSQFQALNAPDVPDSLKFHAYYLMGEQNMRDKNYPQAVQLFSLIPDSHPEYPFAQHSLAIAYVLTYNMEEALNALGNSIEVKVQSNEQREIINRSYVLLGYMFYEQLAMSKAVTALRSVSNMSYYHEDALLGMAWSALRARQWADCINYGQELQKASTKPTLQCEGALLEAYSHLMQKDYGAALSVLTAAAAKAKTIRPMTADTLDAEEVKYRVKRKAYEVLAYDVNKLSLELPSTTVLRQEDSLHKIQAEEKSTIDKYYRFANEFHRSSFFARNLDVVKSDIEYALAIVQKISQQSNKAETEQKMEQKQKDLDAEIDKLKEQMKNLEPGEKGEK